MAPPIASMLSWRWVNLRRSSPVSAAWVGTSVVRATESWEESGTLLMLAQIEQDVRKAMYFFHGVVVDRGDSHNAAILTQAEALHQPRRVHMAIANSDARVGHGLGDFCGSRFLQIEAQSRNAFAHPVIFAHAVNRGAAFPQNAQQLER